MVVAIAIELPLGVAGVVVKVAGWGWLGGCMMMIGKEEAQKS